jgi:hydrogenase expression/formation protein HypE
VDPIFFPGGDIGSLAVYGTVNDLAVCGAKPLYISLGLIIEEGLDKGTLERITSSIGKAAKISGVRIVTGDTKVVGKGSCDRIFINTSGIGEVYYRNLSIDNIRIGDAVIISGGIGEHAISVLSGREEIDFEAAVKSDSAPLNGLIKKVLNASRKVRFMRDPTRGGLATTLNEMISGNGPPSPVDAFDSGRLPPSLFELRRTGRRGRGRGPGFGVEVEERLVPVSGPVRAACELLGFDPLYLACEGRVVAVAAEEDAEKIIKAMREDRMGARAAVIGRITGDHKGKVYLDTAAGGKRLLGMLPGEQLPRIC